MAWFRRRLNKQIFGSDNFGVFYSESLPCRRAAHSLYTLSAIIPVHTVLADHCILFSTFALGSLNAKSQYLLPSFLLQSVFCMRCHYFHFHSKLSKRGISGELIHAIGELVRGVERKLLLINYLLIIIRQKYLWFSFCGRIIAVLLHPLSHIKTLKINVLDIICQLETNRSNANILCSQNSYVLQYDEADVRSHSPAPICSRPYTVLLSCSRWSWRW